MKAVEYWNIFEQTGSINAYLQYACASEQAALSESEEGEMEHESGKYNGNGTFCGTGGGI